MHLENVSAARNWLSVAPTPPGPPLPPSRPQSSCADLNAGDCGSIPVPSRFTPPPPADGSGKFGTPCARMQRASASAPECDAEPPLPLGLLEAPQAASRTARATATRPPQPLSLRCFVIS